MAVGPVTLNGVIQRTQDIGVIKQQEDNKPFIEQQHIQAHIKTQEKQQLKQVKEPENADEHQKKYDAKEKGNNEYYGKQKKKEKSSAEKQNKVVIKQSNHFDMKV